MGSPALLPRATCVNPSIIVPGSTCWRILASLKELCQVDASTLTLACCTVDMPVSSKEPIYLKPVTFASNLLLLGMMLSLQSSFRAKLPAMSVSCLRVRTAMPTPSMPWLKPLSLVHACAQLGISLSATDFAALGLSLSLQGASRIDFSMVLFTVSWSSLLPLTLDEVAFDVLLLLQNPIHLSSSTSIRYGIQVDNAPLAPDSLHSGSFVMVQKVT